MAEVLTCGPLCEVLLQTDEPSAPDTVDTFFDPNNARIERTRKGRVCYSWINGRPIHIEFVSSPSSGESFAACNDAQDYTVLRRLAERLAAACSGLASEPIK